MLISIIKQWLVIALLVISPFNKTVNGYNNSHQLAVDPIIDLELKEVVIKASRVKMASTFLDYKLQRRLNTNVTATLKTALAEFKGPKVPISSLRRHGTKSKHCCGKAVDFEWSTDLIDYLVSEEGTAWREKFGFTFYIESKPGASCLKPYKLKENYKEFVFENPAASGPHIHLNL